MMGKDAVLKLEPTNGASFAERGVLGGYPATKKGGAVHISLGSLQFGQTKDVVVMMNIPAAAVEAGYITATLEYGTRGDEPVLISEAVGSGKGDPGMFDIVD